MTTTTKSLEFKFVYIYWESKQTVDQANDSKCQPLFTIIPQKHPNKINWWCTKAGPEEFFSNDIKFLKKLLFVLSLHLLPDGYMIIHASYPKENSIRVILFSFG